MVIDFNTAPIEHELINVWKLSNRPYHLSHYYLLYWTPQYFDAVWCDGVIRREGVDYIVVYHNCKPSDLRREKQIALSFRQADLNIPAYVLITFAHKFTLGCK